MKIFFRRIHLYLSLGAGIVIMICCLTGALLVFQKELEQSFFKGRYFVQDGVDKLTVDSLVSVVKQSYPTAKVNSLRIYDDRSRSTEVSVSIAEKETKDKKEKPTELKAPAGPGTRPAGAERSPAALTLFINPYTGNVLEAYNPREGFFYKVMALHRWLLGSNSGPGKYITGIATFIFLFILFTGLILWWPKSRAILSQRLKLKWDGGWKRLNHDLHIVLGFYSFIFLFIFAFTALAWSFEWFNKGIYKVAGSSMKPAEPPKSGASQGKEKADFNTIYNKAKAVSPNTVFMNLVLPKDSSSAVTVTSLPKKAVHETATDAVYFDQYSGAMLGHLYFHERNLGARIRAGFRPVHVGSIWGTPSKIIAVLVCLFGASFPITGTIMWINRTRKKKKTNRLEKGADCKLEAVRKGQGI